MEFRVCPRHAFEAVALGFRVCSRHTFAAVALGFRVCSRCNHEIAKTLILAMHWAMSRSTCMWTVGQHPRIYIHATTVRNTRQLSGGKLSPVVVVVLWATSDPLGWVGKGGISSTTCHRLPPATFDQDSSEINSCKASATAAPDMTSWIKLDTRESVCESAAPKTIPNGYPKQMSKHVKNHAKPKHFTNPNCFQIQSQGTLRLRAGRDVCS